jgi:hypothetical protein
VLWSGPPWRSPTTRTPVVLVVARAACPPGGVVAVAAPPPMIGPPPTLAGTRSSFPSPRQTRDLSAQAAGSSGKRYLLAAIALQGCGSGLDPDSVALWIRIRIGNPDPDPGARKWRNFGGKMHFLVIFFILPLKRYKIALTTFWKKIWWKTPVFLCDLTQILI